MSAWIVHQYGDSYVDTWIADGMGCIIVKITNHFRREEQLPLASTGEVILRIHSGMTGVEESQ